METLKLDYYNHLINYRNHFYNTNNLEMAKKVQNDINQLLNN